jgi:hypothetical protein
MTNKVIIFLAILVFSTLNLSAQDGRNDSIKISSVSLSVGSYKPSMDYWNNAFLPNANTSDRFKKGLLYGGNIAFDLPLNLGARAGAWYWGQQVSGNEGGSFNTLNITFTGLSIGAFYKYRKGVYWAIKPYAGVDVSYLMVQDKYDVSGTVMKKSGSDVLFSPFVGIERALFKNIVLGIEYGYFLGSYKQDLLLNTGASNADISIKGSKIQFTIGYKFP